MKIDRKIAQVVGKNIAGIGKCNMVHKFVVKKNLIICFCKIDIF